MNLTPIGLDGLKRAEDKLEKAAKELSRLPLSAGLSDASGAAAVPTALADEVSLSDSMVALLEARHSYEANLKLIETSDELTAHAIDLIG
jgi:flagellar basal body rod protein FlgG